MWPLVPARVKGCWMGDCSCRFPGVAAVCGICIGKEHKDLTQQWLLSSQAMMDSPNPFSSDCEGTEGTLPFPFPVQRSPTKTRRLTGCSILLQVGMGEGWVHPQQARAKLSPA